MTRLPRILLGFLFVSAVLFFGVLAPPAQAWGCKGHQTIAYLAEKHLTPEALKMADDLLKSNPIDPNLRRWCGNAIYDVMADASTWPDDVRSQRKNGPWHYIDIPRQATKGPLAPYCGNQGCVTEAITEQVAILKDKTADPAKRADALRYIIHFVGDLHQPMHGVDNDDHGGNCVPLQYFHSEPRLNMHRPEAEDYSPNLHGIWDTEIVERDMEVGNPQRYADDLDQRFAKEFAGWEKAGIHVDDWAWESHDLANKVAYGSLPVAIAMETPVKTPTCHDDNDIAGRMLKLHIVVAEPYQNSAAEVVELRLAQAGVRLALILNDAAKSLQ
ncbi:MAG TPA: S1/P1 nuclease [Candidatus Acidoferrum sp.]|nr:S1/P1 nuclease [Candidatus Acidoferrum sp.]